jgi:hypothetical protein
MCDGLLLAVPRDMDKSQCPVVAVGRTVLTELDVLVRNDRSERVAGGDARVRPRPDFTGPGRQRDFNAGQPNLAPVVKDKARPSVTARTLPVPAISKRQTVGEGLSCARTPTTSWSVAPATQKI